MEQEWKASIARERVLRQSHQKLGVKYQAQGSWEYDYPSSPERTRSGERSYASTERHFQSDSDSEEWTMVDEFPGREYSTECGLRDSRDRGAIEAGCRRSGRRSRD